MSTEHNFPCKIYPTLYMQCVRKWHLRLSSSHSIRYNLLTGHQGDKGMAQIAANPEKYIFDGALEVSEWAQ